MRCGVWLLPLPAPVLTWIMLSSSLHLTLPSCLLLKERNLTRLCHACPQWDVAKAAVKSFDLQGKTVGSLGGGAIATHVMRRLKVRVSPGLAPLPCCCACCSRAPRCRGA